MSPQALGSRYLLDEPIGQGGMGAVWRGRDRVTGARYAIKVLRPEYAADPAAVARFIRERTALVSFRHPNVVAVHDLVVEGDRLALVMDLIDGGDLGAYLRTRGGHLPAAEASAITAQICAGLAAAHTAGIVHRDLKPPNVLLDSGHVWLADFGIARVMGQPAATTAPGSVMGTASYLAPEAIRGSEPGPAGDVYAAGITLYELLSGSVPFTGQVAAVLHAHLQTPPARPAGLPDRLWEILSACLSKDPGARPSAAELAQLLAGGAASWPAGPLTPGTRAESQPTDAPGGGAGAAAGAGVAGGAAAAGGAAGASSGAAASGDRGSSGRRALVAAAAAVVLAGAATIGIVLTQSSSGTGNPAVAVETMVATTAAGGQNGVGGTGSATGPSPSPGPARPGHHKQGKQPGPGNQPTSAAPHKPSPSPRKTTSSPKPSPTRSPSPSPSPSVAPTPVTACATVAAQVAVLNPQHIESCIRLVGNAMTLSGSLYFVPAGSHEQIRLVLSTPAGILLRLTSPVCSPGLCAYSAVLTEPPGLYRIRADLLVAGIDVFQGAESLYVQIS
jgi:serine/threonine protein kinase, bacterial